MAKFNAAEWKKQYRDSLSVLDEKLGKAEVLVDVARRNWRESDYCDNVWVQYKAAQEALEAARREYEKAALIARDKHYCNRYYYTDIEPYEVVEYVNEKTLIVRSMNAELTSESEQALKDSFVAGGFSGHYDNDLQEWDITPNEQGTILKVRLHKDGYYHAAGDKGTRFRLSARPVKWYDYNF